jgi:hypothetical protein
VLLTLLRGAGETLGNDRMLKTNTATRRVHSLFRQGCILYDLIPMMPESRLRGPESFAAIRSWIVSTKGSGANLMRRPWFHVRARIRPIGDIGPVGLPPSLQQSICPYHTDIVT